MDESKRFGFGLMRLPVLPGGAIDMEKVRLMADRFLDSGFSYFDTGYFYHDGASERAFREAVAARCPRERFQIADKLPGWALTKTAGPDSFLTEQLRRLGVDYLDRYLLHSVKRSTLKSYEDYGCFAWIRSLKERGIVREIGFSFHDSAELLEELLTRYPFFDFVQLQINYYDWTVPLIDSKGVYETAARHQIPVVVMEPMKGGMLFRLTPEMRQILDRAAPGVSAAAWAIRYAASLPNVQMVLSGMSEPEQLEENVGFMRDFVPLSPQEEAALEQVAGLFHRTEIVPCSDCRYCVSGCPKKIYIPKMLSLLSDYRSFGPTQAFRYYYDANTRGRGAPADCIGCKRCEATCPQHLPIAALLKELAACGPEAGGAGL